MRDDKLIAIEERAVHLATLELAPRDDVRWYMTPSEQEGWFVGMGFVESAARDDLDDDEWLAGYIAGCICVDAA